VPHGEQRFLQGGAAQWKMAKTPKPDLVLGTFFFFNWFLAFSEQKGHKLILASGKAFEKPLVSCYGGKKIVATLTQ
jgi:hypothetical protein